MPSRRSSKCTMRLAWPLHKWQNSLCRKKTKTSISLSIPLHNLFNIYQSLHQPNPCFLYYNTVMSQKLRPHEITIKRFILFWGCSFYCFAVCDVVSKQPGANNCCNLFSLSLIFVLVCGKLTWSSSDTAVAHCCFVMLAQFPLTSKYYFNLVRFCLGRFYLLYSYCSFLQTI